MKTGFHLSKPLCIFLSLVFFVNSCLLVHAQENNIWKTRRNGSQFAKLPLDSSIAGRRGQLRRPVKHGNFFPPHAGAHSAPLQKILENFPSSKTIIHIQDIHQNQEAQENIGKTIQALVDQKAVDLILLEGAFEAIDLSAFREFRYPETIRMVADYLFREGKISGPIHTLMKSKEDIPPIVGIDHEQHYKNNVAAYKRSTNAQASNTNKIQRLKIQNKKERKNTFNKKLWEFDQKVTAYQEGKLSLGAFLKVLKTGNEISLFLEALRLEKDLDFEEVKRQRTYLLARLLERLSQQQTKELMRASQSYRVGKLRHVDFYRLLDELCKKRSLSLKPYPSLKKYLDYVFLSDRLDAERLFAEMGERQNKIYRKRIKNDRERELVKLSRKIYLTEKLINFSLTPNEWKEYQLIAVGAGLRARPNSQVSARLGGHGGPPLRSYENFYMQAKLRDKAMADNVSKAIEKYGAKTTVLVTGGFHKDGISKILQGKTKRVDAIDPYAPQQNFSMDQTCIDTLDCPQDNIARRRGALRAPDSHVTLITFIPKITKIETKKGSAYLNAFMQEKTPLEKLFNGNKLFIPLPPNLAVMTGEATTLPAVINPSEAKILNRSKTTKGWALRNLKKIDNNYSAEISNPKGKEKLQVNVKIKDRKIDEVHYTQINPEGENFSLGDHLIAFAFVALASTTFWLIGNGFLHLANEHNLFVLKMTAFAFFLLAAVVTFVWTAALFFSFTLAFITVFFAHIIIRSEFKKFYGVFIKATQKLNKWIKDPSFTSETISIGSNLNFALIQKLENKLKEKRPDISIEVGNLPWYKFATYEKRKLRIIIPSWMVYKYKNKYLLRLIELLLQQLVVHESQRLNRRSTKTVYFWKFLTVFKALLRPIDWSLVSGTSYGHIPSLKASQLMSEGLKGTSIIENLRKQGGSVGYILKRGKGGKIHATIQIHKAIGEQESLLLGLDNLRYVNIEFLPDNLYIAKNSLNRKITLLKHIPKAKPLVESISNNIREIMQRDLEEKEIVQIWKNYAIQFGLETQFTQLKIEQVQQGQVPQEWIWDMVAAKVSDDFGQGLTPNNLEKSFFGYMDDIIDQALHSYNGQDKEVIQEILNILQKLAKRQDAKIETNVRSQESIDEFFRMLIDMASLEEFRKTMDKEFLSTIKELPSRKKIDTLVNQWLEKNDVILETSRVDDSKMIGTASSRNQIQEIVSRSHSFRVGDIYKEASDKRLRNLEGLNNTPNNPSKVFSFNHPYAGSSVNHIVWDFDGTITNDYPQETETLALARFLTRKKEALPISDFQAATTKSLSTIMEENFACQKPCIELVNEYYEDSTFKEKSISKKLFWIEKKLGVLLSENRQALVEQAWNIIGQEVGDEEMQAIKRVEKELATPKLRDASTGVRVQRMRRIVLDEIGIAPAQSLKKDTNLVRALVKEEMIKRRENLKEPPVVEGVLELMEGFEARLAERRSEKGKEQGQSIASKGSRERILETLKLYKSLGMDFLKYFEDEKIPGGYRIWAQGSEELGIPYGNIDKSFMLGKIMEKFKLSPQDVLYVGNWPEDADAADVHGIRSMIIAEDEGVMMELLRRYYVKSGPFLLVNKGFKLEKSRNKIYYKLRFPVKLVAYSWKTFALSSLVLTFYGSILYLFFPITAPTNPWQWTVTIFFGLAPLYSLLNNALALESLYLRQPNNTRHPGASFRHPGEGRDPALQNKYLTQPKSEGWTPAFAGVTGRSGLNEPIQQVLDSFGLGMKLVPELPTNKNHFAETYDFDSNPKVRLQPWLLAKDEYGRIGTIRGLLLAFVLAWEIGRVYLYRLGVQPKYQTSFIIVFSPFLFPFLFFLTLATGSSIFHTMNQHQSRKNSIYNQISPEVAAQLQMISRDLDGEEMNREIENILGPTKENIQLAIDMVNERPTRILGEKTVGPWILRKAL